MKKLKTKIGYKEQERRRKIGEALTKSPTKELKEDKNLAYILGTMLGDGDIDIKARYVRLDVTDKDFALVFEKMLQEWAGPNFSVRRHFYPKTTAPHVVILSSIYVINFLEKYNISKIKKNKNLKDKDFNINRLRKFLSISVEYKALFLGGVYDSEGCVGFDSKEIKISNNNKHILQLCKDLLSDLGIESNKIRIQYKKGNKTNLGSYNKNLYELNIGKKENLIKFGDEIGFSIKEKQDKLVKMIKSYKYKRHIN